MSRIEFCIKCKTVKLLESNVGENLDEFEKGKDFNIKDMNYERNKG